jgi:hypothetical protein
VAGVMQYVALALIVFIMVTLGFAFIWIMDRWG